MSYRSDLRRPQWQRKRLEIFQRDGWTCQSCGAADRSILVHHFEYYRDCKPWEYEGHLLVTLCGPCHDLAHGQEPMPWSLAVWARFRDHFYETAPAA